LFQELEMKQSMADPCLYYAKDRRDGTVMRIATIVDDFNIQGNSTRLLKLAWVLHTERFSMKDMGTIQLILKIDVKINRELGWISLDQTRYILRWLAEYDLLRLKKRETPYCSSSVLTLDMTTDDENFMKDKKSLIRSILGNCWWSTHTHPATKTIVSRLSQLTNSFNRGAWKALMWLCGYYHAKAKEPVFFYRKQWELLVCAFSDSGWKSNPLNQRSRDGFVTLLMENTVHEETHEQPLVALSTSEAECYGMGRAAKFSEWIMLLK
jgi:hypothetical protein